MNLSRISRLVQLIGLLQGGRGRNAAQLAGECGVTRRTIFRDLGVLRQAGVPLVYSEANQQYCVPGTYYLPPTQFTPQEALAVMILCHELGAPGKLPFYHAARSAAVKLENSLPARLRDYLRQLGGTVQIKLATAGAHASGGDIYETLLASLAARRCVRFEYDSLAERKRISTRFSPYRLLFSRHSWYAVGRSSLHRAVRTFHVGRMQRVEKLDDRYAIPRGFSLDRYLRNAWHLIPGPGRDEAIHIRFQPLVARNVADVLWHKTQHTEFRPNGSLDFFATVSGIHEIAWWVLGYGDQAEVLAPAALRKLVANRARNMARQYE